MQRGCLPLPEFYSWEPPKGDLNPDLTAWSCLCHWEGPRSGSGLGLNVRMRTEGIGFNDLRPRSPFPASLGVGSDGEDEHSGPS